MPAIRYVSADTTPLFKNATGSAKHKYLLWGDSVHLLETVGRKKRVKAKARGTTGYVDTALLTDKSLLEVYFIDVGQGDGVLIVTPVRKNILVDGGYIRSKQPSKRNAADFVDWKFFQDYGKNKIKLEAMISSHNDEDHYGGLWDLINEEETEELNTTAIEVDKFYYAGVNWMEKSGKRNLGPVKNGYMNPLLNNITDIRKYLKPNSSGYMLQGQWKKFMEKVSKNIRHCQRVSQNTQYIPGFEPKTGKASIRVLAPIEESKNNKKVLKRFTNGDSQNTNGHSVLLRLDYGNARILLTGDLNAQSQNHILEFYKDNRHELACDVVKACHHGSDDCSYEFLSNLAPGATVISSGDNEGHNHPRPKIVAASALTGHLQIKDDRVVTPLVYSTEISRSYKLGSPTRFEYGPDYASGISKRTKTKVTIGTGSTAKKRDFWDSLLVKGIVYGLVNVRTDGDKILCATLNENNEEWEIESFNSRFI